MEAQERLTAREAMSNQEEAATQAAVSELSSALLTECEKLARKLLSEPNAAGTEFTDLDLALTKLRIMRRLNEVSLDLTGLVAASRNAGATWEQIGSTCGITKQAAYDRWRVAVKTLEEGAEWAEKRSKLPIDPLDQFDTRYVYDGRPARRRRSRSQPQ
ncbi:hypothetical protein [Nocardia sp. NBC_01009]|uniref:hypothetical protein n=1 Tax=Nocardia sp. NBC_01009 TaxID=2975996 RepID=UPI00386F952F|nr:hypothetical protein OHA42_17655 [Nocardia sp. NBC_01009]